MVADQHQVAGLEVQVHPSGGVGQHQGPDPQLRHDPDRDGDLLLGVALVVVDPAPQGGHGASPAGAEDQRPLVALHGGEGETGQVGEGDHGLVFQPVAEVPQPAAQNQAQLRRGAGPGADGFCRAVDPLLDGHTVSPCSFRE